jgi:pilus assembly protein Flp/PilA
MLMRFLKDERGATALEYGLIVTCLSLVIIGGVARFGNSLEFMFANPSSKLNQVLMR